MDSNLSLTSIFIFLNFLFISCLQVNAIPFKSHTHISHRPSTHDHFNSYPKNTNHLQRMKNLVDDDTKQRESIHSNLKKEYDQFVSHSFHSIPSQDQTNDTNQIHGTKGGLMYHLMRFFGLAFNHHEETEEEDTDDKIHYNIPMRSSTSSVTLSQNEKPIINIQQKEDEDIDNINIEKNQPDQVVDDDDDILSDTELWDMVNGLKRMFTKIESILDERIKLSTEEVPDVTRAIEEARKLNVKRDRERKLREIGTSNENDIEWTRKDKDDLLVIANLERFGKDDLPPISAPAYRSKRIHKYENERFSVRKSADVDDD